MADEWEGQAGDFLRRGRSRVSIDGVPVGWADGGVEIPHVPIPDLLRPPGREERSGSIRLEGVELWSMAVGFSPEQLIERDMPLSWSVEVESSHVTMEPNPLWSRPPGWMTWRQTLRWMRECFSYAWRAQTGGLWPVTVIDALRMDNVSLVERDDGSVEFRA